MTVTPQPRPTETARHGTEKAVQRLFEDARTVQRLSQPRNIALIGTYAPRKCGIATFGGDIVEQLGRYHGEIAIDVYALDNASEGHVYDDVTGVIEAQSRESYFAAAREINESAVDAVWLQHEYGIFGGDDGEMVCDLVDRIAAPIILTPHTVLGDPSERQERILKHLVARASRIMVMSRHARDLLATRYGAPHEILTVIEHGAPDRPFGRQAQFKAQLGLEGRDVLTTFGLLGPGKGLEHVIDALPAIVARHPNVLYRIVGATHPNLVAEQGEAYRDMLRARAQGLGVAAHIEWVDRFLETGELLDQLEACDIYLTPYPGMQQSTSGTLSYAVALGKAVISTPYLHARELLANDVGVIVEAGSAQAIADAVNRLLADRASLTAQQKRAYAKGRETIWPSFASNAALLVAHACAPDARTGVRSAPITATPGLSGVLAMSDGTGMLQHAIGVVPDRRHGYCLDDNARALMLMNVAEGLRPAERMQWSQTYASFVQHAWNDDARIFRNFMRYDRTWCEDEGSEDSNGRAIWALGCTIEQTSDPDMRRWATTWFDRALPELDDFGSPRAMAFVMLGAAARLRVDPEHGASREALRHGAGFLARLLDAARRPDWAWFEAVLGYDNPRLCQALIEAGVQLDDPAALNAGLETLAWIAERQLSAAGHFRPIGSDTFGKERAHLPFDQQPLEAHAAIDAARAAFTATREERWLAHARCAWRWFHGANDRGAVLADLSTGRCRDGINPRGANENCGAESILAFQLAHYSMLALEQLDDSESKGSNFGGQKQRVGIAIANP